MFKPTLEKLLKDSYYGKNLPAYIRIPALGAVEEEITKPIHEATLDDLVRTKRHLQALVCHP